MNKLIALSALSLASMIALAYGGMYMPYYSKGMSYGGYGYGGGGMGGLGGGGFMSFFMMCKNHLRIFTFQCEHFG